MAPKDTMLTEFKNAKVRAETLLELKEIDATMTPGLLQSAKEQISKATEAYISMAQLQTQIKSLKRCVRYRGRYGRPQGGPR